MGAPRAADGVAAVLLTALWLNAQVAGSLGGGRAAACPPVLSCSSSSTSVLLPESEMTSGALAFSAWPATAACISTGESTSIASICTAAQCGNSRDYIVRQSALTAHHTARWGSTFQFRSELSTSMNDGFFLQCWYELAHSQSQKGGLTQYRHNIQLALKGYLTQSRIVPECPTSPSSSCSSEGNIWLQQPHFKPGAVLIHPG